jgi:hypothetical protein
MNNTTGTELTEVAVAFAVFTLLLSGEWYGGLEMEAILKVRRDGDG